MERYDSNFDHVGDFVDRWNAGVRRTRLWAIVVAALLVVVGIASAFDPLSLYVIIQALITVALIAGGVGQIVSYVRTPELFRSAGMLVMGVLNVLLGFMLLVLPLYLTMGSVVLLVAFLFIVAGAERVSYAHRLRYFDFPNTGVITATGVLNIVAGVVFLLMPLVSGVALGYIMAAYLIIGGASLFVEALSMKPIER